MGASGEEATLRSAKPPYTGSNPVSPSICICTICLVSDCVRRVQRRELTKVLYANYNRIAGVAESADATDLKSVGG